MKIIDVSVHQGAIDWDKVKASGIEGVIIRAGYGKGNVDGKFKANIESVIKHGFKYIGVYWFSYAYTIDMAKREAQYMNDIVEAYKNKLNLGVYFDWEYDSMSYAKKLGAEGDKNLITNMCIAFCEKVSSLGYIAGYYLNQDYEKNFIDISKLTKYRKWFARYTNEKQTNCYLWQYSSSGKISGISGNVDMNELIGTVVNDKSETSKKKSNNEIAQEVIEGKWGNGAERKQKLEAAGYDYKAIQSIVNKNVVDSKPDGSKLYYMVKKGDTLGSISRRYGTSIVLLKKWNNIKDINKIYIGQKLRVK